MAGPATEPSGGRGTGDSPESADGSLASEILEQIDTPIVVLDLEGHILLFNAACRALTGYSREDAVGRRVWDFLLLPDEVASVRAVFDETRDGEVPTHFINYWLTKSGEKRLLKWSNSRTRLSSGREIRILATGVDITGIAAAENALSDREAHLRSIVDTSPEAIVSMDSEGTIRSFSPAAEVIFGYRPEEVMGQDVSILMDEPYASEHGDYLRRYLETGEPRIIGRKRFVSARRKGGAVFPIRLSVGEFLQGGRKYFVGFIEDLTREEEARQRLQEMQSDLDRYSRISVLGEMTSGIAHELKQPLTAAAAFAEAADLMLEQEGRKGGDPVRKEIEHSLNEVHRTVEIIRNIREFIRKGTPDFRHHDINGLLEDALSLVLSGPVADVLETRLRLAPDLPPVELDRVQIQQVIVNLVRNALEAMYGSTEQRLEVSTSLDGGHVEIRIADAGPGLDPAMEGRLFEPFATNQADGMGLGLAISRTIVEGHWGELTAAANEPHGAVFIIRLPIEQMSQP